MSSVAENPYLLSLWSQSNCPPSLFPLDSPIPALWNILDPQTNKTTVVVKPINEMVDLVHSIAQTILYPSHLKNWNLDDAKAPGLNDRKRVNINNIDPLAIVQSRELSRSSKSNSSDGLGIYPNHLLSDKGKVYPPYRKSYKRVVGCMLIKDDPKLIELLMKPVDPAILALPNNSDINARWMCFEGHVWEESVLAVSTRRGIACTECRKTRISHPSFSNHKLWEEVAERSQEDARSRTLGSRAVIWWQCPAHGPYQMRIYDRTFHQRGCPSCIRR